MASANQINIDDYIKPQEIQGFIRKLQYPGYQLQNYFPTLNVPGNIYRFDKTQLAQEPAVQYRPWDTETPIGSRQGVQRGTTELPALGKKKIMTEEQALKLRLIEAGDVDGYINQIYDDIRNLVQGVQGRWEIDRGTLLSTGALTVTGSDGWTVTVSYGVPGGNIVTANTLWSDTANADIISDLTTWTTAYKTANRGVAPGKILAPETVRTYLLRNAALRSILYTGAANSGPSVLRLADVTAELTAQGLPPIEFISAMATDASGSTAAVFPQNKIVMLPPDGTPVGYTAVGTTGTGLGMVERGTLTLPEAQGIVGLTWNQNDPPVRYNMVDACGMPVLSNPNLLFIATVA